MYDEPFIRFMEFNSESNKAINKAIASCLVLQQV